MKVGAREGAGRKKKQIAKRDIQSKNLKDSDQKDAKNLATEKPPFEAQYLDDGNIEAVIRCDKNHKCMGLPFAEIETRGGLLSGALLRG